VKLLWSLRNPALQLPLASFGAGQDECFLYPANYRQRVKLRNLEATCQTFGQVPNALFFARYILDFKSVGSPVVSPFDGSVPCPPRRAPDGQSSKGEHTHAVVLYRSPEFWAGSVPMLYKSK